MNKVTKIVLSSITILILIFLIVGNIVTAGNEGIKPEFEESRLKNQKDVDLEGWALYGGYDNSGNARTEYKNMFCVNYLADYYSGNYSILGIAEISGNSLKLTDVKKNDVKTFDNVEFSNEIAAIINSNMTDGFHDYTDSARTEIDSNDRSEKQVALWSYWNSWVDKIKEQANTEKWSNIFVKGGRNYEGVDKYNGPKGKDVNKTVQNLVSGGKKYSATIYSLHREGGAGQNIIIVFPKGEEIKIKLQKKLVNDIGSSESGKLPTNDYSVKIRIEQNGNEYKTITLDSKNKWGNDPSNPVVVTLPSESNYKYKIVEESVNGVKPAEGTAKIEVTNLSGNAVNNGEISQSVNVIVKNEIEKIKVKVKKEWADKDNKLNKRPSTITVELYANGKSTGKTLELKAPNWEGEFDALEKRDSNGKEIIYTIQEKGIKDYIIDTKTDIDGNKNITITLTNTPTFPIDIDVKKVWKTGENPDFKPQNIRVKLLGNKEKIQEAILNEENNWSCSFKGLPKYDDNFDEIEYSVEEDNVPGYVPTYVEPVKEDKHYTFTIENDQKDFDLEVIKEWKDQDDKYKMRPTKISVTLKGKNGNTHKEIPELEKNVELTKENGWRYIFKNLPQEDETGYNIEYEINEKPVVGYTTTVSPEKVNTNTDGKATFTITNALIPIDIPVEKKWDVKDPELNSEFIPEQIKVQIYNVNREPGKRIKFGEVTLTKEINWKHTFTKLPKYNPDGKEAVYEVDEEVIPGYDKEIEGYIINNTLETINIPVIKKWNDDSNRDGMRPEKIKFTVKSVSPEGVNISRDIEVEVPENQDENNPIGIFKDLPKYTKDGIEIKYEVTEGEVTKYKKADINLEKSDNTVENTNSTEIVNCNVENTHIPEKVKIDITKEWDDMQDLDDLRPRKIQFNLYANGVEATDYQGNKVNPITLTLEKKDGPDAKWVSSVENKFFRYENGKEIEYTIGEIKVDNYAVQQEEAEVVIITDATEEEYQKDDVKKHIHFKFKNVHKPQYEGYYTIKGKVWNDVPSGKDNTIDSEYKEGDKLLKGIKVALKDKNGELFDSSSITETNENGEYEIRVNYEKYGEKLENKVYKLYKSPKEVEEALKTAYVEFTYDGNEYTTVAPEKGVNKSKGIENSKQRYAFDKAHSNLANNPSGPATWNDRMITAKVDKIKEQGELSERKSTETVKYCDGNEKYQHTNPFNAHDPIVKGTPDEKCNYCTGSKHTRTFDVDVTEIAEINLGLFNREKTDVAILSDIHNVKVRLKGQEYTYLYGIKVNGPDIDETKLQTQFQDKYVYTYQRPVNPADIASIQNDSNELMEVRVTYQFTLKNQSSTLVQEVEKIDNYFDKNYSIEKIIVENPGEGSTAGMYSKEIKGTEIQIGEVKSLVGTEANCNKTTIELPSNSPIRIQPGKSASDQQIYITYKISNYDTIKNLLNKEATLNNVVEVRSFTTYYSKDTLYAENRRGGERVNAPYGGYEFDSVPGNVTVKYDDSTNRVTVNHIDTIDRPEPGKQEETVSIENREKQKAGDNKPLEDDTDIAPSFVLIAQNDKYKTVSGNVWEDSTELKDGYRLGNGIKEPGEKGIGNVKVELLEPAIGVEPSNYPLAKIYYTEGPDGAKVVKTQDAVVYTDENGNYSFGEHAAKGISTGKYVIRYTYGNTKVGTNEIISKVKDGNEINVRNYKSTIINSNANPIYDLYKTGTEDLDWHLKLTQKVKEDEDKLKDPSKKIIYSTTVDNMKNRREIENLTFNNFFSKLAMPTFGKNFQVKQEFTLENELQSEENGNIKDVNSEINIFNFGIAERSREDIFVEKTVDNIKLTLANGQVLVNGNPKDSLQGVQAIGLNQNIKNGEEARKALDKLINIYVDAELIQGSELELGYEIKVTNNSEKDVDYTNNVEHYYFGTNNEGAPDIKHAVVKLLDYMDNELQPQYNESEWTKIDDISSLDIAKYIKDDSEVKNGYVVYQTEMFNTLGIGESKTSKMSVKKLLTNIEVEKDSSGNVIKANTNKFDNHIEIIEIDGKIARVTETCRPGDNNPTSISTVTGDGLMPSDQKDYNFINTIISPPTGRTNYTIFYIISVALGMTLIVGGIILIKKKILKR